MLVDHHEVDHLELLDRLFRAFDGRVRLGMLHAMRCTAACIATCQRA